MDWSELGPEFFSAWGYPGGKFMPEHVEILGQNGSGKSYFAKYILMERARLRGSRIVAILTKEADETIESMGWPMVGQWPPAQGWTKKRSDYRQVVLHVPATGLGKAGREKQRAAVEDLLESLWVKDSNTIVYFDEIAYLQHELDLRTQLERYLREGRSIGITCVATTQRGQGITRYMHSESKWSAFFAPKDEEDAERMAQIAGYKLYFMRVLKELNPAKHEFLLVHNTSRESYITSLPKRPIRIALDQPRQDIPRKTQVVS